MERVLIEFYATWCAPCQTMEPLIKDLEERNQIGLKILRIDIDKNPEIAKTFRIRSVPTLLFFIDGKETWRRGGIIGSRELQDLIDKPV